MVERNHDDDALSEILKAASDPTRRSILTDLVQEGPTRVTDLAAYYSMSLNAVSKHIKVLEAAGLVHRRTSGRVHWISANLEPIGRIDRWFSQLRSIWEMRLERLDAVLSEDKAMEDLKLVVRKRIGAPPEKVFDAWLDPQLLARFMVPCEGGRVAVAKTDAKVGGRFSIVMDTGEKQIPHAGTYRAIEPHSRLVFTWESPFSSADSTVTLSLAPAGEGGTDLELTQVRFADEASRDGHIAGWTYILDTLEAVMEAEAAGLPDGEAHEQAARAVRQA